jgi:hypothetical protein
MANKYGLDIYLPKELKLLLEILKIENDRKNWKIKEELFTNIDWVLFLKIVRHHRVHPLIYSKINNIDKNLIPPYVIETLSQDYKKNTFQMLHLSGEMEQLSKLFTENQIRVLFLKGPVIAADLFGDISLRTSKDLDILIPIGDFKKAEKLLLTCGYVKEEFPWDEWKWMNHHVSFFHPQKGIEIEIHWRLHSPPWEEPSFNILWQRKRSSLLTTYPVYLLGKEDLFLFLVSHGARHGWFRLRWLIDIDQMVKNGLHIDRIHFLLRDNQYHHMVGQGLILANHLLNTNIDEGFNKFITEKYSQKLAQRSLPFIKEMSKFRYQKDYLFLLKSKKQKFLYTMRILFFPSSPDTKTLRLPKSLHVLYFPLRPFLWAWRKTRRST